MRPVLQSISEQPHLSSCGPQIQAQLATVDNTRLGSVGHENIPALQPHDNALHISR